MRCWCSRTAARSVGPRFGAEGETFGEAVFNTGMAGYQEVLTDPSYAGQIVAMTSPHQGNYGVNAADPESVRVQVAGFAVREASRRASSLARRGHLAGVIGASGITGIEGIDTRRLTLRAAGTGLDASGHLQRGHGPCVVGGSGGGLAGHGGRRSAPRMCRSTSRMKRPLWSDRPTPTWDRCSESRPTISGSRATSCGSWQQVGSKPPSSLPRRPPPRSPPVGSTGCSFPTAPVTLQRRATASRRAETCSARCPIFGICLGHQLLAHALGGRTYKMKFGHRGVNQPVKNLTTGRGRDHQPQPRVRGGPGLLVPRGGWNCADRSGKGRSHALEPQRRHPGRAPLPRAPGVQRAVPPRGRPGPHDSRYLFDDFRTLMGAGGSPASSSEAQPSDRPGAE